MRQINVISGKKSLSCIEYICSDRTGNLDVIMGYSVAGMYIHGTDSKRVLGVPKHSGGAARNSVGAKYSNG